MKIDDYVAHDATGLADLVRRKDVTPRELVAVAAETVAARNPAINAVVELYPDQIDGLDESTLGDGPFRGVPFLIKDTGPHLAGRRSEFCSRLLAGDIGSADSHLGALLKRSGLAIIGRSNTPEYSISSSAENALYGTTHNPWRVGYSAGGSTGGGMAAVMSGMVPMAHGSDIGGSIRIPASWCGGIGLKPSRGRVSAGPARDEGGWGLAMNFVQTRSVRDTAAMLDCLAVPQVGDPFVIGRPEQSYADLACEPAKPLRIGVTVAPLMDAPVDPEVAAAVTATAKRLADMGHHVETVTPDFDPIEADTHMLDVWFFGFDLLLDDHAKRHGRTIGPDTLEPITLRIYEHAKRSTPAAFLKGIGYLNTARRRLATSLAGCDIWLTPTTVQVAEPVGLYAQSRSDMSLMDWVIHGTKPLQFCFPHNVMGTPAMSLPLARHSNGLPIGVQLGGKPGREDQLLQLATALDVSVPIAT
jgi:amidase